MNYTVISVPDMNDSVSRVVLNGTAYMIRFTYNDTNCFWKFGLYTPNMDPIVCGIKIVPNFPLNVFYQAQSLPGVFIAVTKNAQIGRNDFANGNAKFVFSTVN